MAGLFQVLWGNESGGFESAETLEGKDGEPLVIPYDGEDQVTEGICTKPWAVDWDGDGDLDLVVGNFAGGFYLFSGEGSGEFSSEPEKLESKSGSLRIKGAHGDPVMADWDGDGDLDMLSGSSIGGAQWAENIAEKGKSPEFKEFQTLIKGSGYRSDFSLLKWQDLNGPQQSTRVWVADLNEDGKLDLLVGDSVTLASMASGLSKDEFEEKRDVWKLKWDEAAKMPYSQDDEKANQKRNEVFRDLYFQKAEFLNEDRTGFVWAYLRK